MPLELNITSRDFKLLPAVEAQIREKVASLDTYYDRISHLRGRDRGAGDPPSLSGRPLYRASAADGSGH